MFDIDIVRSSKVCGGVIGFKEKLVFSLIKKNIIVPCM